MAIDINCDMGESFSLYKMGNDEGIMPFINPDGLRKMFALAMQLDDTTLRFVGLSSMIAGLVLLYIVH